MKKLLILTLVLGLVSSANATLTLVSSAGDTLDPTGVAYPSTTMIGIYNDTAEPGQGVLTFVGLSIGGASWTGTENVHVPPALGGANDYYGVMDLGGSIGTVDLWGSDLGVASTEPYGIGVLADFELMCTEADVPVTVMLIAEDLGTVLDSIQITQVPEPATMLLLGLGGLFLRRRK